MRPPRHLDPTPPAREVGTIHTLLGLAVAGIVAGTFGGVISTAAAVAPDASGAGIEWAEPEPTPNRPRSYATVVIPPIGDPRAPDYPVGDPTVTRSAPRDAEPTPTPRRSVQTAPTEASEATTAAATTPTVSTSSATHTSPATTTAAETTEPTATTQPTPCDLLPEMCDEEEPEVTEPTVTAEPTEETTS